MNFPLYAVINPKLRWAARGANVLKKVIFDNCHSITQSYLAKFTMYLSSECVISRFARR
jgi:hypothetical protein